jgi:hypothetical protein
MRSRPVTEQILSYVITAVGIVGFKLAGKKIWWAWWINVANQIMWTVFALATEYYAFLIGTAFYFFVFTQNAVQWTREHFHPAPEPERLLPHVTFQVDDDRIKAGLQKSRESTRDLQERLRGDHSGS